MNQAIVDRILSAQTLLATGPFLALAIGVLLLVLVLAFSIVHIRITKPEGSASR